LDSPEGKLVGRKGKARQPAPSDVMGLWKTDIIKDRDPDFEYHFFTEEQVRERLYPTQIALRNFETGETQVHDIPAWTLVQRETGPEVAAGFRPDEGKAIDTVLRHGSMCMKIHRSYWDIMQKAQGQRADAYDVLSRRGAKKDYDQTGAEHAPGGSRPWVRVTEQPLQRV
jgi:hypothetical protein